MAELGWTALEVMQDLLQNLMSQGYMMTVELVTCCVPEDPTSPISVGGYVVACAVFYKQGFGEPTHSFLCSLLQFYGLELHHLTPSGILHMASFVTLCEAYKGIEPHFNLWNYLFRAWLQQGSVAEAMALGSLDIFIKSRHGVDPYFHLSTFGTPFLRNDTDAPIPMFTCSGPFPQPNYRYSVI
jgi:hypothetical protein